MPADSSEAGVLAPTGALAPDATIEDLLQATIRDISGLSGDLVRPRWEPEGAQIPEIDVTWIAFGISTSQRDTYPTWSHDDDGVTAKDTARRTLEHDVLVSCYGPSGRSMAMRVADGMQVRQNLQNWAAADLAFIEALDIVEIPSLLKQRWWRRHDMRIRLRQLVSTEYPIKSLVSAQGTVVTDSHLTFFLT